MHIVMARSESENTLSDTVVRAPFVRYLSTENRRITIIPSTSNVQRSPSIQLRLESLGSESEESIFGEYDCDTFTFLPPGLEPNIPEKQRQRAVHAIQHAASQIFTEADEEGKGCCECLSISHKKKNGDDDTPSTNITPEMQKASNQGSSMIKSIIFPSLPALLQDIWVYLELIISILAFTFGLLDIFPIQSKFAFKYAYFALATISLILALTDAFIYSFQRGSIARGILACRKMLRRRRNRDEADQMDNESNHEKVEFQHKCCLIIKKWSHWFELLRNILTELLLYPLLMFDMFDFITEAVYQTHSAVGRTNFSLFVIGGFYLILSVYIMRVFMVAGSMFSLIRIPVDKTTSTDSSTPLLFKFCAHVLGQIIVHFMVIFVVGAKINNENRHQLSIMNITLNETLNTSIGSSDDQMGINASLFLITAIVLGGIIPLFGVMVFFVVNYYWMKEFTIGFWLNMVSLLRGKSFAQAVFGGEGLSAAKSKVQEFLEKSQHEKVKKQLKRFKAPSFWTKFFFPARIPLTAASGLLYDVILLAFIACLMLTDKDGTVEVSIFKDDNIMTGAFIVSVTMIILANIHVLILLNVVLLMLVLILFVAIVICFCLSPLLLLVYCPMVVFLGYVLLFYDASTALQRRYKRNQGHNHEVLSKCDDQSGSGNIATNTIQIKFNSTSATENPTA